MCCLSGSLHMRWRPAFAGNVICGGNIFRNKIVFLPVNMGNCFLMPVSIIFLQELHELEITPGALFFVCRKYRLTAFMRVRLIMVHKGMVQRAHELRTHKQCQQQAGVYGFYVESFMHLSE